MATTVKLKKSSVASRVPTTTDLEYGELAINYNDGKLYYKTSSNTIDYFGATSLGGSSTSISQADSSVAVSDTGTGTITTTVDSTVVQTSTSSGTALSGVPTAPTAAAGTVTTQIATTSFADTVALNKAVAMAIALG